MKKWLAVLIPVIIIAGLIVWRIDQKKSEAAEQMNQRVGRSQMPASVEMAELQVRDIVNKFEATGSVEPLHNVNISPRITGRVEYLNVREGDRVKSGQVLVRLDESQLDADVRAQQAAVAQAKYRLAQAQLTQETTDSSVTTQLRQQQASLASAEADLKQAEKTRAAQYESAKALVEDAQTKIESAAASVANARAGVKSAEANLENATAKLDRANELYKLGYISTQAVEDARTTVSVQQSALETAKGQLQSAIAAENSAVTQKRSAEQQANIIRAKADADLEAARARLIQANAALDYAEANKSQSPAYKQSLEALKAAVSAAQASLDSAISKKQDSVLKSPIDGVITARNLDPGSLASSGQPILTIQAINKVWVTVAVPEDVCTKLRIGQTAKVTFDALEGKFFETQIAQINPSADLGSRQYTIRVILDNSQKELTTGMFARVAFTIGHAKNALAVPREAVQERSDGSSYLIVAGRDGKAEFLTVSTGVADGHWVAITTSIPPSAKVVTMSASPVREGQMLRTSNDGRGAAGRMGSKS